MMHPWQLDLEFGDGLVIKGRCFDGHLGRWCDFTGDKMWLIPCWLERSFGLVDIKYA